MLQKKTAGELDAAARSSVLAAVISKRVDLVAAQKLVFLFSFFLLPFFCFFLEQRSSRELSTCYLQAYCVVAPSYYTGKVSGDLRMW